MAGETTLTIIGNLTAEPELRFTQAGVAVANFTIASTPRTFDRKAGEWRDGDTLFLRCTCWNQLAEHVAQSLARGTRAIAQGRLRQRSYERDGEKHSVLEFEIDDIGPALRYATAAVAKTGEVRTTPTNRPEPAGMGSPA
ncbi:single-stranded DNA-binding protein [Actinosynnema sp. NPDC023587]|uniref:single-stranded DNA-binding protein n=1 Tax=Actinosynnema sp. NPDC023587 TaxID=3154695 RepID=UPI0033C4F35D